MHYQRWRITGSLELAPRQKSKCECGEPVHARGMCRRCYRADYYQRNREAENAWFRAYYLDNAEALKARSRSWYWQNREAAHLRYLANKAKFAARRRVLMRDPVRRERRRVMGNAWRKANPERWALRNRENQRRRRRSGPPVDYAAILEEHGWFCHICALVIVDLSDLHFDHVVPLAAGGPHDEANIRPAHAICNLRKGAKAS